MNKLSQLTLIFVFSTVLCFNTFAQNSPQNIDVRSMEISKNGVDGTILFQMSSVDENGGNFGFGVVDSSAITGIIDFTRCNPCRSPKLYSTNVFPETILVETGSNNEIFKFYITNAVSPPVYLGQELFSRRRNFIKRGNVELTGRIEFLSNDGTVIRVDKDVQLKGMWEIEFFKPYYNSRGLKFTDFKSVKYKLTDTREEEENN